MLTDYQNTSCRDCGVTLPTMPTGHTGGTGYGLTNDGWRVCYFCCGQRDKAKMIAEGRAVLYLTRECKTTGGNCWRVTNWPGSLAFPATARKGRHNIAGTRHDAWFTGPDGFIWHGVNIGDHELLRAKRTREQPRRHAIYKGAGV